MPSFELADSLIHQHDAVKRLCRDRFPSLGGPLDL